MKYEIRILKINKYKFLAIGIFENFYLFLSLILILGLIFLIKLFGDKDNLSTFGISFSFFLLFSSIAFILSLSRKNNK